MTSKKLLQTLLIPVAAIIVWQLVAMAGIVSAVFLPTPVQVVEATIKMARSGVLGDATLYTVTCALLGWLISCVLGVLLAVIITRSKFLVETLDPFLDFARSLPAAALIPPATLLLGYGQAMEIPVIVFGAIWPVLLNAMQGLLTVEPRLHDVAKSIQLSRTRRIFSIELFSALPLILLGARTALSVALIVAVVAEMVGYTAGLGYELMIAEQYYRSADLYATVLLLGVLGLIANYSLYFFERKVTQQGRAAPQASV